MTVFLIAAALIALVAAALIVRPLLRTEGDTESRDASDARVFRDQLDEVDRDLARGVISASEAEGARAEISRRLLRAAGRAEVEAAGRPAPGTLTGVVAGIALVAAPLLGAGVYLATGKPGLPDLPLAARQSGEAELRLTQAEAEARMAAIPATTAPDFPQDYLDLIARLEQIVAERTDDPEGHRLLANAYMEMERFDEAWPLFARLREILGAEAPADLVATQAEAMVLAAGGYVTPEAERVIAAALDMDARHPIARYYAGLAIAQKGRVEEAVRIWRQILADSPPGAPWIGFVEGMIAQATGAPEPAAAPGPDASDMAAAAALSPEERNAMVEGMVARLEERLTTEGGTADEWLRLVNAKLRLGRAEDAARIYGLALEAIPAGVDRDAFRQAVQAIGLNPPAAAPGPSAEDMAAAASMSPEERTAMIEGMVTRLETRLSDEGGEPEEFLRLINAYRVLGRMDDARRAYDLSQEKLDGSAASFVREQALVLGVVEE